MYIDEYKRMAEEILGLCRDKKEDGTFLINDYDAKEQILCILMGTSREDIELVELNEQDVVE